MITPEMKKEMLREYILSELKYIKEQVSELKKEIEDLRLIMNRRLQ